MIYLKQKQDKSNNESYKSDCIEKQFNYLVRMSSIKQLKPEGRLVQKETFSKSIEFDPKISHKVKKPQNPDSDYLTSFKNIVENKFFTMGDVNIKRQGSKDNKKLSHQKKQGNNNNHGKSRQKSPSIRINAQNLNNLKLPIKDQTQKSQVCQTSRIRQKTVKELEHQQFQECKKRNYLNIKYINKLTADCLLIGNQNQVDMMQFMNCNRIPQHYLKWSIQLDQPIEGLATSKLAQSKILFWSQNQLYIYECNTKNLSQKPKLMQRLKTGPSSKILSVHFVKRNIFVICFHSHITVYQIIQINKQKQLMKLQQLSFNCAKHFQVIQIPQMVDNNIKIFYANMLEYDEERVDLIQKKRDVFGLYFVEIQYDYQETKISQIKKIYQIKKSFRHQIRIFNVTKSIFLMNLKTQILAVKNGLIIDNIGVNFKFDNCFLKVINKDVLVHVLSDKIQFYHIKINYEIMPQKLIVKPFDSIYFNRDIQDQYLKIVDVNDGYGIFFQSSIKKIRLSQLKKGYIKYWYSLTYPIPLSVKIDEIFPTPQKIRDTPFQQLDMMCDMAIKMGLSQSQAYRQLWKKSKKQDQKDFAILLQSKNYKIISEEVVSLLKKKAEKFRLISKNQKFCLDFLKQRVFGQGCTVQNLQEYSYCHFLNNKLETYKNIQVEKKRFQIEHYKKIIKPTQGNIKSILLLAALTGGGGNDSSQNQNKLNATPRNKLESIEQADHSHEHSHMKDLDDSQLLDDSEKSSQIQYTPKAQQQEASPFQLDFFLNLAKPTISVQEPIIAKLQDQSNKQIKSQQGLMQYQSVTHSQPITSFKDPNIQSQFAYQSAHQPFVQRSRQAARQSLKNPSTLSFADFLKTSKRIDKQKQDQSLQQIRQLQKLKYQVQQRLKDQSYNQIKINIKDFYFYRDCHLKQLFLQIVAQFMNKQSTFNDHLRIFNLRVLIRNFRLHYRLIYEQILSELIGIYKHKIARLIENFIQLLPYEHNVKQLPEGMDESLYVGIWSEIDKNQLENSLFLSDLTTIENRQAVIKFKENIWFKRYNLTHHAVIEESKEQLKSTYSEKNIRNIRDTYFYLFYQKFFQLKLSYKRQLYENQFKYMGQKLQQQKKILLQKDRKADQLLKRIQQIYTLIPQHLKGFIKLYYNLYQFLSTFNIQERGYSNVYQFLKLRDFQLFKIFFTIEKKQKGFIIKKILPKYQDPLLIQNGKIKFIKSIQSYFDSELSQITDLKTILNRLNGENRQFHIAFQKLYDCLLSALTKKIKLGTKNDTPLEQLLIYIHNIPFSSDNGDIFQKLLMIQQAYLQQQTLKRSQINMSIKQIKQNPQLVISALVQKQLEKFNVYQAEDQMELKMYFYKCIAELLCIKSHFYGNRYQDLVGFIFITQLMHVQRLIPIINKILHDWNIKDMLSIDTYIPQQKFHKCLVYYSYKKRLSSHNKSYLQSQTYIRQLMQYLDPNDKQRMLIELQIKYCHIFKQCSYTMPYPLSVSRKIPILDQIQFHIQNVNSQHLQKLDIQKLFSVLQDMRQLVEPSLLLTNKSLQWKIKQFQRILYEFVFFKHLRQRNYKKSLQMIYKLINLDPTENCTIYNVLLIDTLLGEFNDSTGELLTKLISYFYYQDKQLTDFLKKLIMNPYTTSQMQQLIKIKIKQKIKSRKYQFYNKDNIIFNNQFKRIIQSDQCVLQQICQLLQTIYKHLSQCEEYMKYKQFQIIYRLMLFNPFQVCRYVYNKQGEVNLKGLRAFYSFMSQEMVFCPQYILKTGKIGFLMMLNRMHDGILLNQQIKQYSQVKWDEQADDQEQIQQKYRTLKLSGMQKLVYQNYKIMNQKLQYLQKSNIRSQIYNQLQRVKQQYDNDIFLVMKNNIQQKQKYGISTYLKLHQWEELPQKICYYIENLNQLASYKGYKYLFPCDRDDSYISRGEDQFRCPRVAEWPDKVEFDKIKMRHDILVKGENTRVYELPSNNENNQMRLRKKSEYLPDQFVLMKKSTRDLNRIMSNTSIGQQKVKVQKLRQQINIRRTNTQDSVINEIQTQTQQQQQIKQSALDSKNMFAFLSALQ